jgi:hypothetical protein
VPLAPHDFGDPPCVAETIRLAARKLGSGLPVDACVRLGVKPVSGLPFSNIHGADEHATALCEAVRVLGPAGRLRVVDERADRHASIIRLTGCCDVQVRHLDGRTRPGVH